MTKYLLTIIVIVCVGLLAGTVFFPKTRSVAAERPPGWEKTKEAGATPAQVIESSAAFDADGKLKLPTGYRAWVFVGAPLTPNALNGGEANFPEYHHVYVEKKNVDAYLKTGTFPEGTVFVKELTRVLDPKYPDGSRDEPSGRGYFNGEYNGIDVTVKDSKRFAETNNWGFFTFGHHPLPYAQTAAESPATTCAYCHIANVAKTDMTWIQFYPLLRDKKGY
jgi:Cytochrome P460